MLFYLFHDVDDYKDHCLMWNYNKYIELIDFEGTNQKYDFKIDISHKSCHLKSFMSYRNGTTGEWQSFNLSGNVLVLQNGPHPLYLQIKVFVLANFQCSLRHVGQEQVPQIQDFSSKEWLN